MLCGSGTVGCHGWVEANPSKAHQEGFHVKPWEDFSQTPILLHGKTWAYLKANGDYDYLDEGEK